ncbi:MAG: SPOR domain-containing protein [Treponema sp.]|jgi:hypothetical protein|nr:SPOR domain-containing protein [Treponema sp.]
MKNKFFTVSMLLLAVFVFLSASPWEGAAATAPEGELPATGMFVATNSFPINTVVDITNIETNRSTRVIVAKGLDSPGLLAVVSRDAAELIGMRPGSISRVRMVQPGDPIAYLRFIEGQARGIPGYDSGNVLTEHYSDDTYEPPLSESTQVAAVPPAAPSTVPPITSGVTGPSYLLEPEWQDRTDRIVYVGEETTAAETVQTEPETEKEPEYIVEEIYNDYEEYEEKPEYIAEEVYEEEEDWNYIAEEKYDDYEDEWNYLEEEPEYIVEELEELEVIEEEPEYIVEEFEELEIFEEPEYIVEEIEELEAIEEEPEYIVEELEELEAIEEEPEYLAEVIEEVQEEEVIEYTLVPADDRPPDYFYGMDPNDIIPGIATETTTPEPTHIIPMHSDFSVPRVSQLDRGWYYVQIAALDSPESVQNTLNQIDLAYKPLVYSNGDRYYRILLGPLNQGESAAVLARFRSIGYKDAFVRHER